MIRRERSSRSRTLATGSVVLFVPGVKLSAESLLLQAVGFVLNTFSIFLEARSFML